jgi:hypothetical protein
MKITLLEVKDYKKVEDIAISPGDTNIILIGGNNRQGKSSLIGSLSAAFGGMNEAPEKPIREGAEKADIRIELDGGDMVIHRRFLKSGSSSLKVEDKTGKLSSPQKILDKLVGPRFLDPLRFAREVDKEQREMLVNLIDLGFDLKEHDKERKVVFDERTDVNRDAKRYKVELDANPDPGDIPEVNTSALTDKMNELMVKSQKRMSAERDLEDRRAAAARKKAEISEIQESIDRMKTKLANEEERYAEIVEDGKQAKTAFDGMPDVASELEATQEELKSASVLADERSKKQAQKEHHDRAKKLYGEKSKLSKSLTSKLEELDLKKKNGLANADMPVPNLEIGDESLIYNGMPLSQASGAESLRVSLAIAAAMSPKLKDIWVQDGALLDANSLALVQEFAKEHDLQIWLERVGEHDDGALIIEEGLLKQ